MWSSRPASAFLLIWIDDTKNCSSAFFKIVTERMGAEAMVKVLVVKDCCDSVCVYYLEKDIQMIYVTNSKA